jgi:hypothetical protein
MATEPAAMLDQQIDRWRNYLHRRQAIRSVDVAELENHLREQVAALTDAGLATDEAFLVAVKRMGDLDALAREFAREHSDRLWKQLVAYPSETGEAQAGARRDGILALCLAAAAAVLVKLPALFGFQLDANAGFYARNLGLFVLPLLTGYFAWKRRLDAQTVGWLAAAFAAAAIFANVYPFTPRGHTEALTALHLPIALWLLVGLAYAGSRWSRVAGRMDFIRFSGELFIYYSLIALGGGVLTAFTAMIFKTVGIDVQPFFQSWLLPYGAVGAVVIGAWLVEAKQSVIENMAPVLAHLFTPLFAAVLVVFLGTLLWTGRGVDIERNLLIGFDLLLVMVLGLQLYSISARDPHSPPRRLRCDAGVAGGRSPIGRRGRAVGHRCTHHRIRLQPEPRRRLGREPGSACQSGLVRSALYPVPASARRVHGTRALADGLFAGLCGVGGDGRDRVSAPVRGRLIGLTRPFLILQLEGVSDTVALISSRRARYGNLIQSQVISLYPSARFRSRRNLTSAPPPPRGSSRSPASSGLA